MAAKKVTAQQQKEKREKIILGVLLGVLVLVGAIQAPKLMGGSKQASSAPPATTSTTASGTASLTAAPAAAPAGGSQLTHLGSFAAKNPFKAQVSTTAAGTAAAPARPGVSVATSAVKTAKGVAPVTLAVTPAPKTLLPQVPQVPAALLLVNGKKTVVPLNGTFPKKSPLFQLVGISPKEIELKLIGGSLSGGDTTFKLLKGHPLRLVNQTAGTRFVLAMIKPTTAPKPVAPATPAAAPATTTPPAAATTSTTPAIPPTTTVG